MYIDFLSGSTNTLRYRKLKKLKEIDLFPYSRGVYDAFFRPNTHFSFVVAQAMARHFLAKITTADRPGLEKDILLRIFNCYTKGEKPFVDKLLKIDNLIPSQSKPGWHSGSGVFKDFGVKGFLDNADTRVLGNVVGMILSKNGFKDLDSLKIKEEQFEGYYKDFIVEVKENWSKKKLEKIFSVYDSYINSFWNTYFHPGFDADRCKIIHEKIRIRNPKQ